MPSTQLEIGTKIVGSGRRPLLIAEVSANHGGSFEKALEIVKAAADCGADAIKLQTFTAATLTIDSRRPEFFIDDSSTLWHGRRLWELYEEAHTPWEWHQPIFDAARAAGLSCISTAFDAASVEFLLSLDVDAIKVASFELIHTPLLQTVSRSGKPVLLSTGMSTVEEIDDAVAVLRASNCNEFVLLKCTSAYPAEERDANILTMRDMSRRHKCEVGLSDHTLSSYAAFAATALGASVIEKHLTLRRADGGLDSAFSIEPAEFRELVRGIDLVWQSCGEVHYGPVAGEAASVKERPSIYVVRRLRKGDQFTEENIRIIRPSNGLAPKFYRSLLGKSCTQDIEAEVPMSWDFLESTEDRTPVSKRSTRG